MLDEDVLNKVLTHIDNTNSLPVWLTCKGFAARRPVGGFATAVRSMYATPAMFAWATNNGCPPPQSLSRATASVLHAIDDLEPASRAPWIGALFQWMKHPSHRVSDYAYTLVREIDPASLTPHAGVIAGFLQDTDDYVSDKAMITLSRMEQAAITPHASTIAQLLEDDVDKQNYRNFSFFALHALYKLELNARTPYIHTIARTEARRAQKVRG